MRNPSRRNKNIGTSKQGHGQNNKMVIPSSWHDSKVFFERLEAYQIVERSILGHPFRFVVEQTRSTAFHSCTIEDLCTFLAFIPATDYGELSLIVLRQPKRKESMLNPVWGRLIYSFEFEGRYEPAIILEAVDTSQKLQWPKKQSLERQREFRRLKEDGHVFEEGRRHFTANFELNSSRRTQLYRTLPHEFGHYVHYCKVVERPLDNDLDWNQRWERYEAIAAEEKERFAHDYALRCTEKLKEEGLIPFERVLEEKQIQKDGLRLQDFEAPSGLL